MVCMYDAVAEARVALKELANEDRGGWSPRARSERVRELSGVIAEAQAERLRLIGEWDSRADWAEDGQLSPATWLAWQTQVSKQEGSRLVRDARFLRAHPDVADALAGGEIAPSHVEAMARAERGHEDEFTVSEDALLTAAKDMNPTAFSDVCRQWAQLVDDRRPAHDFDDRAFRIQRLMDGWGRPDGLWDPEMCTLAEAVFKDLAPPDPTDRPEGPRSARQRNADAMADLFRRHLRGDDFESSSTTVDVVVDADTLAGGDEHLHDPAWSTCRFVGGPILGRTAAERLLCDSPVGRLVVSAEGEILDVGRQARLFSRAQRRALTRRDGGCAFPGCDRPAQWCDAHHLLYWEDGGRTDLANAALLCRRHHVLIHSGGWTLERDPTTGVFCATSPAGRRHHHDPLIKRRALRPDPRGSPQPAMC